MEYGLSQAGPTGGESTSHKIASVADRRFITIIARSPGRAQAATKGALYP